MMTITVSEVLNRANALGHQAPATEREIELACEQCATEQTLADCRTTHTDEGLEYRCSSCPDLLVIVSDFVEGTAPWPGRAWRMGPWVIRNVVDFTCRGVRFPALPNAPIKR